MADISSYKRAFREAVYGEEVRKALIDLADAVNTESDGARQTAQSFESRVASLETDNTATKATVQNHESRLTTVETKNGDQDRRLSALESDMTTAKQRIQNALAENSEQGERLDTLEETADSHSYHLSQLYGKAEANETLDNTQNNRITELENSDRLTKFSLQSLATMTTENRNLAHQALSTASNLENEMAETSNSVDNLKDSLQTMNLTMENKIDGAYVENGYLILTSNGEAVSEPIGPFAGGGGGGGGSAGNAAVLSVQNNTGWLSKTIASGDSCFINLSWTSDEDNMATGDGTLKITVNGSVKAAVNVPQGNVSYDVAKYLNTGSNVVKANISDVYGNNRTINFSVTVVAISISSTFDASSPFTGAINFTYTPLGSVQKTVHFIVDGTEVGTVDTPVSNRQMTYTIPAMSHGAHTLECYFTAEINGGAVRSNTLFYDLICVSINDFTPVIAVDFNQTTVNQYSNIVIPYSVFDPASMTAQVQLKVNGNTVNTVTVDRSKQLWTLRADEAGPMTLSIVCGGTVKTITLTVTETTADVHAETADLALALSSYGRSNGEANPGVWESGNIACNFQDFNFVSDGWQTDADGSTVLRVSGDARLTIPYQPFASDFRTTGKTIEIEFATRDVRDYDAEIISCMSGGRGLKLTAQEASLKSEQSSISMQYKDDEHIRVSFVTEKRAENRLIYCYVDGIISGVVQYPDADDFSQNVPADISIGSSDCTVDLYNIRIYDNDLKKHQILDNWIADTPNGMQMLERYAHNNVYDEYGQIVIANLPKDLPYMILEAAELPQSKGDKKIITGQYVDPINSSKSFTFENCQIDVQGTSSAGYARKNYKMKFNGGFQTANGQIAKYAMRDGAIPTKTFTFKADVASSEGCNNVELVRLYNEICPYKTPPQLENGSVRQGIDGFPIVIFWNDGVNTTFLGKYNFNNDKGTEEVYGFASGSESWETLNNTSDRALFKSWNGDDWTGDFEGRYPDGNTDVSNLQSFVQTVSGWSNPTKAQIEAVAEKQSALFYYLFTELFLMVDSRAKNAFPSKFVGGKWCWLPYDFDTAIGINNEGQLAFGYNLETGDTLTGGADVFNGEGHKFWKAIKDRYQDEIASMYETLRNSGQLSYAKVENMFSSHQAKWPEAVFNEDSQYKYLDPMIHDNDGSYLTMLQGSKKSQRQWWLKNRFKYMDSKYNVADNKTNIITVRGYAKANLEITPYADMYVNVKYGSYLVSTRAEKNTAYTMACPLDNVNDTETYIYGCDCIKKIDGLPAYQVGYANFSMATKLIEIVLGSSSNSYRNERLTELYLGNLNLLKKIDCRNCVNLGTGTTAVVDASGCSNIEEIYMDGTQVTGVNLPNGGQLRVLRLPSTITNLTLRNQRKLEEVVIPSYAGVTTLWIENCNLLDPIDLLDHIAANARVRLIGFDLGTVTSTQLKSFMDKLDTFRGLDENGNNTESAQVSGTCHIASVTGEDMAEFQARYPYITVTYDHLTAYVYYYTEDGSSLLYTETVQDGGNATWTGTSSKSSTAQYNYTFDGWSSTANGSLWSNAQKAVSENRNLYAHFTASLRYYTVYFYNGSTLLQTVNNVPYGGSASYSGSTGDLVDPSGSGQPFQGWYPTPTSIQGNTSCYAQYMPPLEDTITDSWDTIISNINAAATGADCGYSLGDTKIVDFGSDCGPVCMQLVAFDMDNLADNSGKAKTTWVAEQIGRTDKRMNPNITQTNKDETATGWASTGTTGEYATQVRKTTATNATQTATFTITAETAGTLSLKYKMSNSSTTTSRQKLTLTVNGSTVTSTAVTTYKEASSMELAAGETVTVTAEYLKGSGYAYYGSLLFESTGTINIAATMPEVTYQVLDYYNLGTGSIGGWENSEMRTYVRSLKANLPANLQNAIKDVTKTSTAYNTARSIYTQSVTDDLWIPDYNEMFSTSESVKYTGFFTDANARKKYKAGVSSAGVWWLRRAYSASNGTSFYRVSSNGSVSDNYSSISHGVVPGFCI